MDYVYVAGTKKAELVHYGRKGQKWYQRIFGSLDPRAKYNRENIANATDQELRDFNNRKQLEDQYLNNAVTKGVIDKILERAESQLINKVGDTIATSLFGKAENVIDKLRAKPAQEVQPKKNDPPKQPTQQNQPQKKKK